MNISVHDACCNEKTLWLVLFLLVEVDDFFDNIVAVEGGNLNTDILFLGWRSHRPSSDDLLLNDDPTGLLLGQSLHVVVSPVRILH